jgi:hypothetical protein
MWRSITKPTFQNNSWFYDNTKVKHASYKQSILPQCSKLIWGSSLQSYGTDWRNNALRSNPKSVFVLFHSLIKWNNMNCSCKQVLIKFVNGNWCL